MKKRVNMFFQKNEPAFDGFEDNTEVIHIVCGDILLKFVVTIASNSLHQRFRL
jgi:hypothetical protein